jgi:hypothetical protein
MNLWNTIKGWFSTSAPDDQAEAITYVTATLATPVEVEEESEPATATQVAPVKAKQPQNPALAGEMFATMCREAGVKQRYLESTNAITLFQEWYTGEANEEDIKAAIAEFKKLNPPVNAKLSGKI